MCIAIYSPIGTDVPTEEIFKNCFTNNPDGAGFAFNLDNGQVQIIKGLMTFDKFKDTFNKYKERYGFTDRGVLIHFRITTHGGTQPACCHPFPMSDYDKMLKKTECVSNYAVIHNGIIKMCSARAHALKNMSDTMVFVKDYLSKIASNKGWFKNPMNWELIEDLADSKIAILNGQGEIRCTTGFHEGTDGNFYSNCSYTNYYYSYKGLGKWSLLTDETYTGGETYGRYDYESGWSTSSKKESTYSIDYSDVDEEDVVLMRLQPNEEISYKTNYYEVYDADIPMYVGVTGSVYAAFDGVQSEQYPCESELTYMGLGCIVNAYNPVDDNNDPIPVPFREDAYVVWDMTYSGHSDTPPAGSVANDSEADYAV